MWNNGKTHRAKSPKNIPTLHLARMTTREWRITKKGACLGIQLSSPMLKSMNGRPFCIGYRPTPLLRWLMCVTKEKHVPNHMYTECLRNIPPTLAIGVFIFPFKLNHNVMLINICKLLNLIYVHDVSLLHSCTKAI